MPAKHYDDLFRQEVEQVFRYYQPKDKNMLNVPLPPSVLNLEVSGRDLYRVDGIPEEVEYFKELNGEEVWAVTKLYKRKYDLRTHDFERDEYGEVVLLPPENPKGSMIIGTRKNIRIPYTHEPPAGYAYHDYKDEKGRVYYYSIPKRYIYKINQACLILTRKQNHKVYGGQDYNLWRHGVVSLYIIPYNPKRSYSPQDTRILATGYAEDYSALMQTYFYRPIEEIQAYWVSSNTMGYAPLYDYHGRNLLMRESIEGEEVYTGISETDVYTESREEEIEGS